VSAAAEARLWQLISPAAPVGAFHYSQGLEAAVEHGWVDDAAGLRKWLHAHLGRVLVRVDLPLITRAMAAWNVRDTAGLLQWDALALACRETRELRDEQRQMGHALGRLARGLGDVYPGAELGYTVAFGVMAANRNIPDERALAGFGFAWCENQIVAAQKLLPIGQIAGQQMLGDLAARLDNLVGEALCCDDASIGLCIPHGSVASARHETQYSRLFRS